VSTWPTRVAGLLLVLLAMPLVFAAFAVYFYGVMFLGTCSPGAPVCRNATPIYPLLGLLGIAAGVIHGAIGIGVLLRRRRAMIAGLLVSVVGVILALNASLTAFKPIGSIRDDDLGQMVPVYDTGKVWTAAAVVPYGVSLVILAAAVGRGARRPQREVSPSP